jgi:hypothetical protein
VTSAVPVTVRLFGHPGVRPVPGEVEVVMVTVPVNPFSGVMVIVELPVAPELKSAGDVAVTSKSGAAVTLTEMKSVWVRFPLVPVTWTL